MSSAPRTSPGMTTHRAGPVDRHMHVYIQASAQYPRNGNGKESYQQTYAVHLDDMLTGALVLCRQVWVAACVGISHPAPPQRNISACTASLSHCPTLEACQPRVQEALCGVLPCVQDDLHLGHTQTIHTLLELSQEGQH
jgi:hypothetical protein